MTKVNFCNFIEIILNNNLILNLRSVFRGHKKVYHRLALPF